MPSTTIPTTPTPTSPLLNASGPNAADESLANSLNKMKTLNQYFIEGNTEKPIGNRFFIDTGKKDDNGNIIYSFVDNMKYGKTPNGAYDMKKTGFLASYDNQPESFTVIEAAGSMNVEVEILDANDNLITKTITLDEYNTLPCTAFPDNCKKFKGVDNCEECKIANGPTNTNDLLNMTPAEIDAMAEAQAQAEIAATEEEIKKSLEESEEKSKESQEVFDVFSDDSGKTDGFQNFYGRYKQPLNNYQLTAPSTTEFIIEKEVEEKQPKQTKLVIEDDMVTKIWLGSITLLGLFIVAKYV